MTNTIKVERKGSYQGVPQWGISGSSEITPSHAIAVKWAQLANAEQRYQHEQLATEQMSTSSYPAPERDPLYLTDVFYGC